LRIYDTYYPITAIKGATMSHKEPTIDEWKELFEVSRMLKELAPWKWMEDSESFGVENPETGEVGYGCIMGALGEVFGLIVYLGSEGLAVFEKIQSGNMTMEDEDIFASQKCLAVTFDDREMLDNKDLATIKSLGLKFRGRQAWPCFRSHLPGFLPWHLTGEEARFLALAIRWAMNVAEKLRENPLALNPQKKGSYLVGYIVNDDGKPTWHEEWRKPVPFTAKPVSLSIDELRLAKIKKNSQKSEHTWEVEFFYAPFVIHEGERPFYPYIALYSVHNNRYVVNFCLSSLTDYETRFLENFLELLEKIKMFPKTMMIRKQAVYDFFKPIADVLGISLKKVKHLPAFEDARVSLINNMAQ